MSGRRALVRWVNDDSFSTSIVPVSAIPKAEERVEGYISQVSWGGKFLPARIEKISDKIDALEAYDDKILEAYNMSKQSTNKKRTINRKKVFGEAASSLDVANALGEKMSVPAAVSHAQKQARSGKRKCEAHLASAQKKLDSEVLSVRKNLFQPDSVSQISKSVVSSENVKRKVHVEGSRVKKTERNPAPAQRRLEERTKQQESNDDSESIESRMGEHVNTLEGPFVDIDEKMVEEDCFSIHSEQGEDSDVNNNQKDEDDLVFDTSDRSCTAASQDLKDFIMKHRSPATVHFVKELYTHLCEENPDNKLKKYAEPLVPSPHLKKIPLCKGSDFYLSPESHARIIGQGANAPKQMLRAALVELFGNDSLKGMCAMGNSAKKKGISHELLKALHLYIWNHTLPDQRLAWPDFIKVINKKCESAGRQRGVTNSSHSQKGKSATLPCKQSAKELAHPEKALPNMTPDKSPAGEVIVTKSQPPSTEKPSIQTTPVKSSKRWTVKEHVPSSTSVQQSPDIPTTSVEQVPVQQTWTPSQPHQPNLPQPAVHDQPAHVSSIQNPSYHPYYPNYSTYSYSPMNPHYFGAQAAADYSWGTQIQSGYPAPNQNTYPNPNLNHSSYPAPHQNSYPAPNQNSHHAINDESEAKSLMTL